MDYEYVMRNYGRHFRPGQRVYHDEVKRNGVVGRVDLGCEHYVQVRFDGDTHSSSCHPLALGPVAAETMIAKTEPKHIESNA